MLQSIFLKFTELAEPLRVPAHGVTVFVGANNSGKSLVLREIEREISSHQTVAHKLLHEIEIAWPSQDRLEADIEVLKRKSPVETSPERIRVGRFRPDGSLDLGDVPHRELREFVSERREQRWVASQFLRFFLIRLDGRTRFALAEDRPRGDLLERAPNMLVHLFQDGAARKKVSDIVFDAFQLYFTIEQLSAQNLRIRLSPTEPDEHEQNWSEQARRFHKKATYIKDTSDGVQAFVGIACAVLAGDYRAILIDEPEAFLHPPLARKLGYQLTSNLAPGGMLMASTHSPDFLMGCLQASPLVRVVRLEYANGRSKGKIVDSSELTKLFKAPLFRSANVISALFHDGVVVTESDNDRAFYSEIYHRLAEQEKGYPSLLFVNAQNKQTIRDIVRPLRAFGVPAVAVVDIDLLKEGGGNWIPWLEAARVPTALHVGWGQQRASLHKLFTDKALDMHCGGINLLPKEDKAAANVFFDQLQKYGIFCVRGGEVESWLQDLGIKSKKSPWTVEMLERLGSDPSNCSYVKPAAGDVWDFVRDIVQWVRDPDREGTD